MAQYTVGDYIRENREQRGISQEELSFGICTPASLSRIENGTQMPSRRVFEALMQRMGKDEALFHSFSSKKEMEKQELILKLTRKLTHKDFDDIWDIYQELEKRVGEKDKLDQQYLCYTKAVINRYSGIEENIDVTIQQLIDALYMTQPKFDVENPPGCKLLTFDEIIILNNIAILYRKKGNQKVALRILFYLKEYMERNLIDEKEKGGHYPLILSNLARWLLDAGRKEEALELTLQGIDACIKYGKMAIFPGLLVHKGTVLNAMGNKKEAIETYRQAYYVSLAVKDTKRVEKLKQWLKEYDISVE